MSEGRNGLLRLLDGLYESAQDALGLRNKSYSDVLNQKADALGDGPEHTLAYYENLQEDPMKGLSESDLRQINEWMKASENLSSDAGTVELTNRDKADIQRWMKRSENLPLELEGSKGILDGLASAWDDLCGRWYMSDLENLERRERAAKAAKR